MKARTYRQRARAAATAETRSAILDAVDAIFLPNPGAVLSLDQVAKRARTTVQTVLRHFGSKAKLLEEAASRGLARIKTGRDEVPVGDLAAIVDYLARHYEETAPRVLRMLAVEYEMPEVARIVQRGRDLHRAWVERVLGPLIAGSEGAARRRQLAALIVATDLLTWKLLRIEQGLSRRDYQRLVLDLLEALR
jgi:AcrR family transcriptional regulator